MGKEKEIGLITIYHVPNYGSVLQAYATQKILENAGATCSMLNYRYPNEWHIRKDSLRKRSLKAKVALLLGLKSAHRKSKKLSSFRKKYYHFTKEYESLDALKKEDWSGYDAFCVGSDQVWNSRFTLGDSAFMLSFVPDDKFKFSLASSFSANIVPMDFKEKYRKFLAKFDVLSVREQNGNDIVENDLKLPQKAQVVLDPTLLLNKAEWLEEFPVKEEAKEKYILVYVLTYAFESRPYVYEVIK